MADAKSTWTGLLTFGMVSVPVKLYAAARSAGVSFNQVHECGDGKTTKINEKKFCSCCNRNLEYAEVKKGYEVSKGQFIIVSEDELKALQPSKANTMEISEFVKVSEIDPIYFNSSSYIVADKGGEKAYELLYQTMRDSGLAGYAKYVSRGYEYNVFIRAYKNGLVLHTVFTDAEVRALDEFEAKRDAVQINPVEVQMAKTFLEAMVKPFDSTKLVKAYDKKVQKLVDDKIAAAAPQDGETVGAAVPDLAAALAASLAAVKVPATTETAGPVLVDDGKKSRSKKAAA